MDSVDLASARLLQSIEAFSDLTDHELSVVAQYCAVDRYGSGDTVFDSGSRGEQLFIIADGEVIVSTHDEYGNVRDVGRYLSGDSFGELDLFSNTLRTASARCSRDSRLLTFPRRGLRFEDIIERHPEMFARALHRFITVVASRIRTVTQQVAENSPYIRRLRTQGFIDKLTGTYNRAYLNECGSLFDCSQSAGGAILIVKPDNFKAINDTYGHDAGDAALRFIAGGVKALLPQGALALRYRGNEFCVVFPGAEEDSAVELGEKLRRGLRALDFSSLFGGNCITITFSVGIALYPRHARDLESLAAISHETVFGLRDSGGDRIALVAEGCE